MIIKCWSESSSHATCYDEQARRRRKTVLLLSHRSVVPPIDFFSSFAGYVA
jgi:hypothetical protein